MGTLFLLPSFLLYKNKKRGLVTLLGTNGVARSLEWGGGIGRLCFFCISISFFLCTDIAITTGLLF